MAIAPMEIPASKQPGQRSSGWSDAYLTRFVPTWNRPSFSADAWRNVVRSQEVAGVCRDTIVHRLLALDWKITPRDSEMQDELRGTIRHYTQLFEKTGYGCDLDYTSHVEWVMEDLLDTPFGGCSEIGRKENNPLGRVVWVKPLDVQNLYPTLNYEYPVAESYLANIVVFPKEFVARTLMSPLKKIEFQGWGMAPPEKIFRALQMIGRGDSYYANLLLDIPSVGILDLGDMEHKSAQEWVAAYQTLLANGGNGAFKIPVLYEHTTDVKFIPFGKVPNDIMYDQITARYMSIVCAGYGLTLADIGLGAGGNGGDTLAGAIRSERLSNKNGFALAKKKWTYYANQILPPTLQWTFIDFDDEHLLNMGRARLATSTAFAQLKEGGFISSDEGRSQMMVDGLFTIAMPESAPTNNTVSTTPSKVPERPGMVGSPVQPSFGGYGEIRSKYVDKYVDVVTKTLKPAIDIIRSKYTEDQVLDARNAFDRVVEKSYPLMASKNVEESLAQLVNGYVAQELKAAYFGDGLDDSYASDYDEIVSTIKADVSTLLGQIEALSKENK